MSGEDENPLFALLTDIAEGVATLSARIDAIEAATVLHQAKVNEALATIAEIATRTYYVSKPPSALPDEVINAGVMDTMICRWPKGAVIGMSRHDRQLMSELGKHSIEAIDRMIAMARANIDPSNASRLRMAASLALLNEEKEKRARTLRQASGRDGQDRQR